MTKNAGRPGSQASPKRASASQRVYTLEAVLTGGPPFWPPEKKHPTVSRTVQIRGSQTLEKLHEILFDAFARFDPHLYEFQFGDADRGEPGFRAYGIPDPDLAPGMDPNYVGDVAKTRIASLGLKPGDRFRYWFDFGDDWMHDIRVIAVGEAVPRTRYPRLIEGIGAAPPQYVYEDD